MANLEELIDRLARDAGPVQTMPHPLTLSLGWLAGAAAYLALSLWLSGLRPDLAQKLSEPWFAAEIAALAFVLIATTLSAAVLAFPDLHRMPKTAWAPAGLFALFAAILLLAWRADAPPAPLPPHSFECTLGIALFSLLPAAWTFVSLRKLASTHCRWAASIALLSAFSVGALWLRLHEVNDSIAHVVFWHYLPMLAIALIGWGAGKTWLKW